MKQFKAVILISLVISACSSTDIEIEQILRLEDQRIACDSLLTFLNSPEPKIRARTVEALGKRQDPKCLHALLKMLNDANQNVRLETAFALGQLGNSDAEEHLVERLNTEEVLDVKIRIVEALGKIGTDKTFPVLIELFKASDAKLRSEAALSVGRMALRKLTNSSVTDSLTQLLKDKDARVRWKACYSLMRIETDLHSESLLKAANDEDARVRMFAAQALGQSTKLAHLEALGRLLRRDPDWRVRVKAANALGNYPLRKVANLLTLLEHNHHVRIAVIQAIGNSALQESGTFRQNSREFNFAKLQLEEVLKSSNETELWTLPEKGRALISYAQLLGKDAIDLIMTFSKHPSKKLRVRAMEALGATRAIKAVRLLENQYENSPTVVKIAILESLTKLNKFANSQIFSKALQERDMVLTALAAKALSQDTLRNNIYAQAIIDAYQNLTKPVDVESAQMIFQAMGKIGDKRAVSVLEAALRTPDKALSKAAAEALQQITGKDYSDQIAKYTKPHLNFSYKDILKLKEAKALIKTNRGHIEIKLFTEQAPLTVLNFVQLAQQGFYDGLTFHRVVPNFVIQGGDPRGDSWGSPGYSIRSEFNQHPYLRGTVGMASAGKDTEGCQFFITHSPQPHLDGRYTVFGQVTSGMDVVDSIQEGDVMQLVAIKR
ncbi:MAG: HEAT repeat domain-containing protein [bacterium]